MSVGKVLNNNHGPDKQAAFNADITYVTASDLAWLYLSDNTSVMNVEQLVSIQALLPLTKPYVFELMQDITQDL